MSPAHLISSFMPFTQGGPIHAFSNNPALNNSNPLTAGLAFAIPCLAAGTLTDLVTSKTATTTGGITTDTSGGFNGGIAIPGGSTTARADFGVWQPVGSGDLTIVSLANPASGANQGVLIGQCDSAAANFIALLTNSNLTGSSHGGVMTGTTWNGATEQGAQDLNGSSAHFIDGAYHCWGLRVAAGVPTLWCDGSNVTNSTANVTGTITNASQHVAVGNFGNFSSAAFSAGCTVILALGFASALSDGNMASITSNPFQVFV